MKLCLDVGNTHLCGGIFDTNHNLLLQFRYNTSHIGSSDQLGIFLVTILKEHNINVNQIKRIGVASVVPSVDYSISSACIKYLKKEAMFLQSGIKTGIQVSTHNPNEVGSDLIAGVMAAKYLYPNQNILIFDLGTATTCCYLKANGEFVGASIAPGIKLMAQSLQSGTAKLFGVDITTPNIAIGKNTKNAIQSGIFYSQLGLIKELITATINEYQLNIAKPLVIGTGGFAHLFNEAQVFDFIIPELVLIGIRQMLELN
jgi:type III pantothenate kinase